MLLEQRIFEAWRVRIIFCYGFSIFIISHAVVLVLVYLIDITLSKRTHNLLRQQEADNREKECIGAELYVATQIQASMLPCIFPAFPKCKEFDIYATMQLALRRRDG